MFYEMTHLVLKGNVVLKARTCAQFKGVWRAKKCRHVVFVTQKKAEGKGVTKKRKEASAKWRESVYKNAYVLLSAFQRIDGILPILSLF